MYPILNLDCIVIKVKENNQIINKSVFLGRMGRRYQLL